MWQSVVRMTSIAAFIQDAAVWQASAKSPSSVQTNKRRSFYWIFQGSRTCRRINYGNCPEVSVNRRMIIFDCHSRGGGAILIALSLFQGRLTGTMELWGKGRKSEEGWKIKFHNRNSSTSVIPHLSLWQSFTIIFRFSSVSKSFANPLETGSETRAKFFSHRQWLFSPNIYNGVVGVCGFYF